MENEKRTSSATRQIYNLLILAGASLLCGILVAVSLILYYGPTGSYVAGNVLLSPEVLEIVNYKDTHPNTGAATSFVFDSIELSYLDPVTKKPRLLQIGVDQYETVYQMIAQDKSLHPVSPEVVKAFYSSYPTTLTIRVKAEKAKNGASKAFQQVIFIEDHYRIELREGKPEDQFAYYSHPHIYKKIINLLIPG